MLTKIMFGLELEGSWDEAVWDKKLFGVKEVKSDGSLTCDYPAELTTYPMVSIKVLEKVLKNLDKYYLGWNSSCGCHIHVSVAVISSTTLNYYQDKYVAEPSLIASNKKTWWLKQQIISDYYEIIQEITARFPEVEKRLVNTYCEEPSFSSLGRTRYQAINILSRHGTIEFRLFPANELERYIEYTDFLVKLLEKKIKKVDLSFVF